MYKGYNMKPNATRLDIEVMIPDDDLTVTVNEMVESNAEAAFEGFERHFDALSLSSRMMMKIILCTV